MLETVGGLGGALLLMAALWMSVRVASTLGPHCRCGHHRSVHRLPDTGCIGTWPDGQNALGVKQHTWCPCHSYRPTETGWWERVQSGAEEHKFPAERP